MKKIKISILIAVLTASTASAQFLKGSKHFGLSTELDRGFKYSLLIRSFNFQYFIKDNFAIGFRLNKLGYAGGDEYSKGFIYEVLPGVRKYFGTGKFKTFIYADIGIGQAWNIETSDYSSGSNYLLHSPEPFHVTYLKGEIGGGAQYAITNWLTLEATAGLGLSQVVSSSNLAPSTPFTTIMPNIGLGLKFTLPPKVKKDKKQLTD